MLSGCSVLPVPPPEATEKNFFPARMHSGRKEILLCGLRRRHRQNAASGQHGGRSRLLRHDRHHGQNAFGCAVCRIVVRSCACGNDGPDRHGQQPDGGRIRRRGGGGRTGHEVKLLNRAPLPADSGSGAISMPWRRFDDSIESGSGKHRNP